MFLKQHDRFEVNYTLHFYWKGAYIIRESYFLFCWSKLVWNTSYLNTPWPHSDLLALICAALEVSAPTPAITVNQPSTHCIINRWSVSVARITHRLFTCETRMQKLWRHGESKVTELWDDDRVRAEQVYCFGKSTVQLHTLALREVH